MRALRAEDPAELGGHRLVARLGAGGMGVVYLARTGAGELVALKVIRAEHAADPHFRARFRREARLAAGVRGRWVVRVTDADAEARAPWLATAFVPGPSLAEAVVALGPLPARTVLTLGQRVADALAGLHATGLVHRDVKPANILLARDGPRLIDFGIARGAGATALTAPDAVLGTPGYLAPEQMEGAREGEDAGAGPASDVFSLGCALAFATTGRPPFGTGAPAVVMYRTVHEEPDLTGLARLPAAARASVTRCLSVDPAARPSAAELREELERAAVLTDPRHGDSRRGDSRLADPRLADPRAADPGAADVSAADPRAADPRGADPRAPESRAAGSNAAESRAADPRAADPRQVRRDRQARPRWRDTARNAGVRDGARGEDDGDWLPPGVLRLVAVHASRALDPPPREAAPAQGSVVPTAHGDLAAPAPAHGNGNGNGNGAAAGEPEPAAEAREAPRTHPATEPDPDPNPDPEGAAAARPGIRSRRRMLAVGGAATAVLAAGVGAAVVAGRRAPAAAPTLTIGLQSAGTEQERGARLAVDARNARSGARYRLALTTVDDHGRAADAESAARRLIADPGVRAVLGPTAEAAVNAANRLYAAAGMPMVLVASAGLAPSHSDPDRNLRTQYVTRVPDDGLGIALARYLTVVHPTRRTAVVEDLAGNAAGSDLARSFRAEPPGGGTAAVQTVAEDDDPGPAVAQALSARPDAFVYAGTSPDRAATCARALTAAGFTGARVTLEPVMRSDFLRAAGRAAEGWVFAAPYTDAAAMTTAAAREFTAAYRTRYHASPGPWAAEGYDAVALLAHALDSLGDTTLSRSRLTDRLARTTLDGVAKPIRFTDSATHDLDSGASFLYQVRDARFHFLGRYDQMTKATATR
ncbi:bifunctional serine/threonine-protein kinase/ABC transporter substrate-binding protein [Streptomyces sp. TS71-3]|uniref:bifunctional serine/threonine-protein kinase/ABC transporter substrate-binding protein n=1 Tax=Streptomyces sp. TS71-3 TaxID=2733862 RepID=UPI001B07A08D|nr:bifunctional serine/threonine-protein kinase/ABC transporter substrate-binding protein [Streptomyces sp. TS71-3]GHJ35670.1 hypothetical protein Sm713_12790 [Streptomyces sp. TS71-3]